MPKTKHTITRDSVFRNVGSRRVGEADQPTQGIEETRTHQTAVWLGEEEIEWLDNQVRAIQRGGWRGVTRSALIRALIRAASQHKTDLSGATGEVEIAERFSYK